GVKTVRRYRVDVPAPNHVLNRRLPVAVEEAADDQGLVVEPAGPVVQVARSGRVVGDGAVASPDGHVARVVWVSGGDPLAAWRHRGGCAALAPVAGAPRPRVVAMPVDHSALDAGRTSRT